MFWGKIKSDRVFANLTLCMVLPSCAFLWLFLRFLFFLLCFCLLFISPLLLSSSPSPFSNCWSCRGKPNFIMNGAENSHQLVRSHCWYIHASGILQFFPHFIHCRLDEGFKSQNFQEFQGISLQLSPSSNRKKSRKTLGEGHVKYPLNWLGSNNWEPVKDTCRHLI